jgi:hypothetical protein
MLQSLQKQMQKKQQQQQNIIQKEMLRNLQLDLMPWMIHKKLCLKQNILSGLKPKNQLVIQMKRVLNVSKQMS